MQKLFLSALGWILSLSQWFHKPFPPTTTLIHHINDVLIRWGEFKMDNILKGLVRHTYYRCVCVCACVLSHIWLFATLCTVIHQAPLSMEFPRQRYWSGLPFPPPGDLPDPGIKHTSPGSPAPPALAGRSFTIVPPGKPSVPWRERNKSWTLRNLPLQF